jgi:hypothetical protein
MIVYNRSINLATISNPWGAVLFCTVELTPPREPGIPARFDVVETRIEQNTSASVKAVALPCKNELRPEGRSMLALLPVYVIIAAGPEACLL